MIAFFLQGEGRALDGEIIGFGPAGSKDNLLGLCA